MVCSDYEVLITGFVDGELDGEQSQRLMSHLKDCATCRKELERVKIIKKALDMVAIRTPEDEFWDGYWAGIYNRLERNTGWIFLILGAVVLCSGGSLLFLRNVLFADDTPVWVAVGGVFAIIGIIMLLVSLIRERVRINRHERYKDVRR
ncbi:zf-HC2 domain-containing protein [bacterium]|nr:zf-HC2 domain-containing protein [candidate division CSSED10-310 bacterium]